MQGHWCRVYYQSYISFTNLFFFCLEFPAAEISWLLLWRCISCFSVHFLQQQLDMSWLLSFPLPAASSLLSFCGYLDSELGKIGWCGNFYGHRQQGRTFSCWNMTGTQAARRHRSFVSNRGKGNGALKPGAFQFIQLSGSIDLEKILRLWPCDVLTKTCFCCCVCFYWWCCTLR